MEKITIDEAIKKGQKMVNIPILVIMILGLGLTSYLIVLLNNGLVLLFGFIITFVLMWFWWSYKITKWRVWAFENCRNVHELKRRAVKEKLIWPDGSIFERTEIRSIEERKKLEALKNKFKIADELELLKDDGTIPAEIQIYYSKIALIINYILGIGVFCWGISLVIEGNNLGFFVLLVLIGFFFFLFFLNEKSPIRDAYIVLNSKGMKTLNTSFVEWENIKSTEIFWRKRRKKIKWYLISEFNKRDSEDNWGDEIEITHLTMSPKKIEQLIKLYEQRSKKYR